MFFNEFIVAFVAKDKRDLNIKKETNKFQIEWKLFFTLLIKLLILMYKVTFFIISYKPNLTFCDLISTVPIKFL